MKLVFKKLEPKLVEAFNESALPGENVGFDDAACLDAVRFVLEHAISRDGSQPCVALDSVSDGETHRHIPDDNIALPWDF